MAILRDGTCMECFPYSAPGLNKRGCVNPVCGDRQKIDYDGQCVDCPDYMRNMGIAIECAAPPCRAEEYLTIEGKC